MNGKNYKPIIDEYKRAKTTDDKVDSLFTLVEMGFINHLAGVDRKIRWLFAISGAALLAVLFQNQISLEAIFAFLVKLI